MTSMSHSSIDSYLTYHNSSSSSVRGKFQSTRSSKCGLSQRFREGHTFHANGDNPRCSARAGNFMQRVRLATFSSGAGLQLFLSPPVQFEAPRYPRGSRSATEVAIRRGKRPMAGTFIPICCRGNFVLVRGNGTTCRARPGRARWGKCIGRVAHATKPFLGGTGATIWTCRRRHISVPHRASAIRLPCSLPSSIETNGGRECVGRSIIDKSSPLSTVSTCGVIPLATCYLPLLSYPYCLMPEPQYSAFATIVISFFKRYLDPTYGLLCAM